MRRIQVLSGLLLFLTVGCNFFVPQTSTGGGGGGTNTGDYIYVGNGNDRFMAGFGVSSTGSLSVLNGSPYNNGIAVICSAIVPGNTFLYAGTTSGIFIYAINSDGSMTVQNAGKIAAQDVVPTAMQVDSTGGYLLAAGVSTSSAAQAIAIGVAFAETFIAESIEILRRVANGPFVLGQLRFKMEGVFPFELGGVGAHGCGILGWRGGLSATAMAGVRRLFKRSIPPGRRLCCGCLRRRRLVGMVAP